MGHNRSRLSGTNCAPSRAAWCITPGRVLRAYPGKVTAEMRDYDDVKMPILYDYTFVDPAAEAREALRGLAHAMRKLADPSSTPRTSARC